MFKLDLTALQNANYAKDETGYYQRIDTSDFTEISATNYYQKMLINSAIYNSGEYVRKDKNGNDVKATYEIFNIELINPQQRIKSKVTINANSLRLQELMYFCGVEELQIKDVITESGKEFKVAESLVGHYVDVFLDNFRYKNGYLQCDVLGFFNNGYSVAEIISKTQVRNDINMVKARAKGTIGQPISQSSITPIAPAMTAKPQSQARVMPSMIATSTGYAGNNVPMPSDNDIPF